MNFSLCSKTLTIFKLIFMVCSLKMTFTAPVIVASSVENLWLYGRKSLAKPHLTEALWLGCGAAGMKVSAQKAYFFTVCCLLNVNSYHYESKCIQCLGRVWLKGSSEGRFKLNFNINVGTIQIK